MTTLMGWQDTPERSDSASPLQDLLCSLQSPDGFSEILSGGSQRGSFPLSCSQLTAPTDRVQLRLSPDRGFSFPGTDRISAGTARLFPKDQKGLTCTPLNPS